MSIPLKILFTAPLRNFSWPTHLVNSLLTALVWGWQTLSKSSTPNFMWGFIFYKSFSIKLVIIKVFPFHQKPNPFLRITKPGLKNKAKPLRWKPSSVLCLWKPVRTGHSFYTERNSLVSRRESQGCGFSQTPRGIAGMMIFHCEIPSATGWRAVSRFQHLNHSWIYTAGFAGCRNILGSSLPQQSTAATARCSSPSLAGAARLLGRVLGQEWSENASIWCQKKTKHAFFLLSFQTLHIALYTSQFELVLCAIWIFHLDERGKQNSQKKPQSNIITFFFKHLQMLIFNLYS